MGTQIDGLIARARAVRIENEIGRLGLQLKRVTQNEFVGACPRCGDGGKGPKSDRFSINIRKQIFNCRGCGKGGDVIDLVQLVAGVDFLDVVRELAGERARAAPQTPAERPAAAPGSHDNDAAKTASALWLWREAFPIEGTLAETYLRQVRGLELPDDVSPRVLRFHPRCRFELELLPCLIALWRSIAGDTPVAIIRTALTSEGNKIKRLALGPVAGAAIKLTADEDVTYGLTVGEGLETTLAGMAEGFKPAWVLGLPGIMKLPVLAGVDCLTILVDNDKPDRNGRRAGPEAARECTERWTIAGRDVRLVTPHAVGADMADVVKQRRPS